MSRRGTLTRANIASNANTEKTLSISAGDVARDGPHFGQLLKPIFFTVSFSAATTATTVSVTLNSGLGADYDVLLKTESYTGTDWVWSAQGDVPDMMILPYESRGIVSDALDLTVAAAGAGIIAYLAVYYEVI